MRNESPIRVLGVAAVVCVACSIVVATTAVGLHPLQEANGRRDRQRYILLTAGLIEPGDNADVAALFEQIEARVVDLQTGRFVEGVAPAEFVRCEAKNQGTPIPREEDIAGLGTKPSLRVVYVVSDAYRLRRLILPVEGRGLWSTMHGFVALGPDLATVEMFCVYDHAETPGLGGEVSSPEWLARWNGKTAVDDHGRPILEVIKGAVNPQNPGADHQIDGLSGATLTGRGVTNLMQFWLGPHGYGPLLDHLRAGGDHGKGI